MEEKQKGKEKGKRIKELRRKIQILDIPAARETIFSNFSNPFLIFLSVFSFLPFSFLQTFWLIKFSRKFHASIVKTSPCNYRICCVTSPCPELAHLRCTLSLCKPACPRHKYCIAVICSLPQMCPLKFVIFQSPWPYQLRRCVCTFVSIIFVLFMRCLQQSNKSCLVLPVYLFVFSLKVVVKEVKSSKKGSRNGLNQRLWWMETATRHVRSMVVFAAGPIFKDSSYF